jgi:uncharacterized protein involved in exopolysaccharide biosynthesis
VAPNPDVGVAHPQGRESMNASTSLTAVLWGWRRLIVRVTVAAVVLSAVASLLLPSWYRATATILPPGEQGSSGLVDLMTQIGGGGVGVTRSAANRLFGRSPVIEAAIGILKSRHARGAVVDRHDLVAVYHVRSREHAINVLGRRLIADTTPEGLVQVQVEDRSPERAAALANEFLKVLDEFNRRTSVEDARRTVKFIEERLEENQRRREEAATKLREFQEANSAIEISEQARATVKAIADLQAERTSQEVQRRVLGEYASPNVLEVQRLDLQIREIDRMIEGLEGVPGSESAVRGDDGARRDATTLPNALVPLRELPALALRYAQLEQDVLVQEKVRGLLAAQLEDARIREARETTTITVLDEAVPPLRRNRPRRSLIVLVSTVLAVACGAALSLGAHTLLQRAASGVAGGTDSAESAAARLADRLRRWAGPRSAT